MPISSQAIIDTLLADVNAVIPNFASMVTSYRLLVGAAEEIHRTPGVPGEIFQRAVERYDRAGSIIDILLELLCCKISFSSDFLAVTCAPVDLFRLLANTSDAVDTPQHTAEQILQLEVLRRALERVKMGPSECNFTCAPTVPVPPPEPPAPGKAPTGPAGGDNEIAITVPVTTTVRTSNDPPETAPHPNALPPDAADTPQPATPPTEPPPRSPLTRRHI